MLCVARYLTSHGYGWGVSLLEVVQQILPNASAGGGDEEFVCDYRCYPPFAYPFQGTKSTRSTLKAV